MSTISEVILDIRPQLQAGQEPFALIMDTVSKLGAGQAMKIITPFQPTPLFALLKAKGFGHQCRKIGSDHWESIFSKQITPVATPILAAVSVSSADNEIRVDARGLEPPEPMVRILTAWESLPEGGILKGHIDRRPIHLLNVLAERGVTAETEEQPDGSWFIQIRK